MCDWRLFFHFCQKKNGPLKKKKKWKKKNCGRPTGFNFSHPLDRKQNFFMDSPTQSRLVVVGSQSLRLGTEGSSSRSSRKDDGR